MRACDEHAFDAGLARQRDRSARGASKGDATLTASKAWHGRLGFTVIELLVVVAIIVTLIGVLVPSLWKAYDNANKARTAALLGSIETGLAQYFSDFNMYPPSRGGSRGSVMLGLGLMGAGGDPQFGFRIRTASAAMGGGGQIYGPYVQPDPHTFKVSGRYFVDPWGHEILYYRTTHLMAGASTAAMTQIFGTSGTHGTGGADNYVFDTSDCSGVGGASSPATGAAAFFGLISSGNSNTISAATTVTGAGGYLLISAGPDEKYFTSDDIVAGK